MHILMLITFHDWDDTPMAATQAAACSKGDVQIWRAAIACDPGRMQEILSCLSRDELDRAARFLTENPRLEFLRGRHILRCLLAARLAVGPDRLIFGYGPYGKPFLRSPVTVQDLHFNISHSGGQIVIALCNGRRVGVDIERVVSEADWLSVARTQYSVAEVSYLMSLPMEQRASAFYRLWTCKEAFLKATGQGLNDNIAEIEVRLHPGQDPELKAPPSAANDHRTWLIRTIPLPAGYEGTVVVEESLTY